MRWQELKNREIIDVSTGERLGLLGDCDLEFDPKSGQILKLLIPEIRGYLSFMSDKKFYSVSWDKIKKIGSDTVIIEK
ncbi:YlmC/YmxH family sporulation protein [Garciella nitratireducens]|uniref:Sporulation protein, YlmC/YmxH family n=1 Tax=Garciella nitratireducens DSM 15102 TaxID=1121911 RepID=A0A1T4JW40_9FIRM|nr:YlmC/YmxH family sporulation protein [Garciella nitratireducens]RBP36853.1 YlmC/YmxH family sporulation protein [Garciella nitratireducens]SJZ34420.1 sporulation protein, YlmC/YmxH family [Garciella nitratireducens DSM 15102]